MDGKSSEKIAVRFNRFLQSTRIHSIQATNAPLTEAYGKYSDITGGPDPESIARMRERLGNADIIVSKLRDSIARELLKATVPKARILTFEEVFKNIKTPHFKRLRTLIEKRFKLK